MTNNIIKNKKDRQTEVKIDRRERNVKNKNRMLGKTNKDV
jgi:hypothetical protein